MKALLKTSALAILLVADCSVPMESWDKCPPESAGDKDPVFPTAPPMEDLHFQQGLPAYQQPQDPYQGLPAYQQQNPPFYYSPPPPYSPRGNESALIYPNLSISDEEDAFTEKKPLEVTNPPDQPFSGDASAGNTPPETRSKTPKRKARELHPAPEDEESDPEEGFLFTRHGDALSAKDSVKCLVKHVFSRQITTDKESNLYTVYDAYLEQVVPIVERYFSRSETCLDLIPCLKSALKIHRREYLSPCSEDELFSRFLPCSRFLEKLRDSALLSIGDRAQDAITGKIIRYVKSFFVFGSTQENEQPAKQQVQDEDAAKSLHHSLDMLGNIREVLVQSGLVNPVEFLPCAELASMLVKILDHLRINGAFRKPKAFKQSLCGILKLNFFAERLQRLQDGLSERNFRRAELNYYRYSFFKARFFETLKEFNSSYLVCVENISPEYINLNSRNRQCVYTALSALRCFNSLTKLMATLLTLSSSKSSSLRKVEDDLVFVSSSQILYALRDVKDARAIEILSGSVKQSLIGMLSSFRDTKAKPYGQAFDGELRPEDVILGSLLPPRAEMAKHNLRMRELESALEKKIVAAYKHDKKLEAPYARKDDSNVRMEFGLIDYICELALELTGRNISHVKSRNSISPSSLDTLLRHALESPEHNEIRGLLFADVILRDIFEKVDDDYGSKQRKSFKRLSVDDDSYGAFLERLKESFFMDLDPTHLHSLSIEHSAIEAHYRVLRGIVLVMAGIILIFFVVIYLYVGRGSSKFGHNEPWTAPKKPSELPLTPKAEERS